ncbi:MAG: outer membrane protein assembly factor BamA [Gammaproteobacteria bacterium]|nr:outer membrane protein assembly factor BamA [Gammaproteobacteria bacterium]
MYRLLTVLMGWLLVAPHAWGFAPYTVDEIRVEGLQRISEGAVFNNLPVSLGDRVDQARVIEAMRALFKTGFFKDVRLLRDGNTLLVSVQERPSIAEIAISGNEDITSEQLLDALKFTGLEEGRVFDKALLDRVELELQRQYFSQGKYGVKIKTTETELERNRVDVAIHVTEGEVAKLKQITIVGNDVFPDELLLEQFQLSIPTWYALFSDSDKYSKQKLSADLETLRSFYLDQGYINFSIDSTQVSISPDKSGVYITINVSEGDQYSVKAVKLSGELVVAEEELRALLVIKPGDVFSRKMTTQSRTNISDRLGVEGYAFSNVNPIPEIIEGEQQVVLTFFVDPGKRIYVRRIEIAGNLKTRDEVLRREMRQLESAWLSTASVDRSRVRLQRLGFFDDINIETPLVPGVSDQVDVKVDVTERPSGNFIAGFGFSQSQGLLLNASISENNFLGTGKRISAAVNNSKINTVYNLSYTDPYDTLDGVSRGMRLFFRETDARAASIANFTSDVYGGSMSYGIPLNEYDSARLEVELEHTTLRLSSSAPGDFLRFVEENDSEFDTVKLISAWSHDTRNRSIFADKGVLQSVVAEVALPVSGLEYYKLSYSHRKYIALTDDLTLLLNGDVAYGGGYGGTTGLPFFERYYAGGGKSLRGYRRSSLGPHEGRQVLGGALRTVGNVEVIFPPPFAADSKSFRMSLFVDGGNVFAGLKGFERDELRYSVGISAIWLSPIAPLTFSYARPFRDQKGDRIEAFQFSFGTFF